MSELICNLPAQKVYVRREYLRDLEDGFGEFVDGVWVSCKSIPCRAFYFETYLPHWALHIPTLHRWTLTHFIWIHFFSHVVSPFCYKALTNLLPYRTFLQPNKLALKFSCKLYLDNQACLFHHIYRQSRLLDVLRRVSRT